MPNSIASLRNRDTDQTLQEAVNRSYDFDLHKLFVEPVSWDGTNTLRPTSDLTAEKITIVGSIIYIAVAAIGSAQSAAVWQARKIDTTGITITFADANANFDNVATDLTALSYS